MNAPWKAHMQKGALGAAMVALSACAVVVTNTGSSPAAVAEPTQVTEDSWRDQFSGERIRADINFLADDALRGRDADSPEFRIAANYVAAQFARLGLKPAGDNGTYFQEVPFQNHALDIEQSSISLSYGGETHTLEAGDDYYLTGNLHVPDATVSGELVFAGYGIQAPELGRMDLDGLDLAGKVAVVIGGAPTDMHTEVRAHFGSTAGKAIELMKRGAVGILIVNTPRQEAGWNGAAFKRAMVNESMDWLAGEGADVSISGRVSALISHDAAKGLFDGAEMSLEDVMQSVADKSVRSFPLNSSATIVRKTKLGEAFTSPNVLAVYEGSDPALKDEYVITSGHLDHVGAGRGVEGQDVIHNGAMDNAAGISTMLEVARNLVASPDRPRRSILFAAVTAEERGLLGAGYFAHKPTVPLERLVGNVNLDMPILTYDFADVVAFGADRSSIGPITQEAVKKAGVTLAPDPWPEMGLFTRSDHYRFVQKGIPAVFLMTGWAQTEDGDSGEKAWKEFLSTHYHKVTDDPNLPIRYDAASKFAYVNYLILTSIANEDKAPVWNEGDFFGNTFGR